MSELKAQKTQASEVTYELHSLGWKAFQHLCITIAAELWGQTVQTFYDSHDGGRDGAFSGVWKPRAGESFQGTFTAQCKFTSKADKTIQLLDLKDELTKAQRLAEAGLANNYILFTNARLTGANDEKMRKAFEAIPGIERFAAYGCESISRIILESPRLRMLVPRVYGLGDLSQILDERAYDQAQEIINSLGDDLAKFIVTDAHKKSAKALVEHGFVLLLGEPACGKSTIAAALAVGALDLWGCSTIKVRDADDFVTHWNPREPKQFFWIDDAFGATQFDWSSSSAWNKTFPHINAAIGKGAKVLFTSRDYIYNSAKRHLKESALPLIKESHVVIRVENITKDEREQILYNHIRLGTQPKKFKHGIKRYLPGIAIHKQFSPETARRLGHPTFTKSLFPSKVDLDNFVAHPLELLCEIINTMDDGSRSALALVFMRGGVLPSPVQTTIDEDRAISRLGGSLASVLEALKSLNGSLLLHTLQGGSYTWRFKHPTVLDAFAVVISENPELTDIYLTGTPLEQLFKEVTCGDVGIQGVKVIVPSDHFDSLISRIETLDTNKDNVKRIFHRFLAYRCNQDFLTRFVAYYPQFIFDLSISSYLYVASDVDVIVRLDEYGILPEPERRRAVDAIRVLAVNTPDSGFLRDEIRNFLTEIELAKILEQVRVQLLPKLDGHVSCWRRNYNNEDDPEDYFSELSSTLEDYIEEFQECEISTALLEAALFEIEEIIEELKSELPDDPDPDDFYNRESPENEQDSIRSVFDDVDS